MGTCGLGAQEAGGPAPRTVRPKPLAIHYPALWTAAPVAAGARGRGGAGRPGEENRDSVSHAELRSDLVVTERNLLQGDKT